jgi:hypothetical protein
MKREDFLNLAQKDSFFTCPFIQLKVYSIKASILNLPMKRDFYPKNQLQEYKCFKWNKKNVTTITYRKIELAAIYNLI